jgi:AcrR family transcriptional regulator
MKTAHAKKRTDLSRSRRAAKPTPTNGDTRDGILAAAREVLFRQGYEQLTTRRVAERAGITVGNLTYHFPSKRELLRALIQRLVAEYSAGIERFFADLGLPPEQKFKALIEWLMADSVVPESNRIFRELWAMALHDQFVARAIDDFYDEAIERIAQVLCHSYAGLSKASADAIAHLLATISEGSGVLYGTRQTRTIDHAATTALAVEVLATAVRKAAGGKK